jgi:pimeloyl-ACP methyl ester carboxylesterase
MRGHLRFVLLCLAAAGCSPQVYVTPERLERGLVLVLTGIEGRSPLNQDICRGLDAGGVNWAIELVDWTSGVPGGFVINLRDEARNRRQAGEIADRIARYQTTYPNRPVVLVGQSGGGGIAAWTAEALKPDKSVDGVILLAASLSPGYPLEQALERSRRGIVSFHSRKDWIFLWAGTTVWGTMDGKHTSAAGRVAFDVPVRGQATLQYKKLFQIPLQPRGQAGYIDPHIASSSREFVARYVAPLVLTEKWEPGTIEATLAGERPDRPMTGGR